MLLLKRQLNSITQKKAIMMALPILFLCIHSSD
jgi:hypothetical protein